MSNEWMLDLISDLRVVAEKNYMCGLTEVLDDALIIAAREIRQSDELMPTRRDVDLGASILERPRTGEQP